MKLKKTKPCLIFRLLTAKIRHGVDYKRMGITRGLGGFLYSDGADFEFRNLGDRIQNAIGQQVYR